MKIQHFIAILILVLQFQLMRAQGTKNLSEMLGYPKEAKLLIIHADDIGLCQSVNAATIKAFENKAITSGSIMMPCPWANDFAAYYKNHPGMDVGIHTTLTAEWETFRWPGLMPQNQIKSLLDEKGYLFSSVEALGKSVKVEEAEKEIIAQIEKAKSLGLNPSHIDTHMGSVLATPDQVKVYMKIAMEYKLPFLFPRVYLSWLPPDQAKELGNLIFLLDNLFMLEPQMIKGSWLDAYKTGVETLKPGLNMIIVHLAFDNDEMKAVATGHPDYGSEWRQKDLELVQSKEFKDLLRKNNIVLINWAQIRDLMNASYK
jgi:hypothetical protein